MSIKQKTKKRESAFKTIREVAEHLNVEQHVLRFWETKFHQVKPLKRGGGRRYYRQEDIVVLEKIYSLLYKEGYTIKGAQNVLKGNTRNQIADKETSRANDNPTPDNSTKDISLTDKQISLLKATLGNLKDMRQTLQKIG